MTPIERAKIDLAKMGAEIARLRIQLQSLEHRSDKVHAYIEMAEFYELDDGEAESGRPRGGVSGAAVRASVEAIRERKQHIHTRELLEILAKQGIQVGGSNPVGNLSGFLSRSEELRNSRARGWGLANWEEPPDDQSGVTPAQIATTILQDTRTVSEKASASNGGDLDDEIPF